MLIYLFLNLENDLLFYLRIYHYVVLYTESEVLKQTLVQFGMVFYFLKETLNETRVVLILFTKNETLVEVLFENVNHGWDFYQELNI